jgi:hypothetical protein
MEVPMPREKYLVVGIKSYDFKNFKDDDLVNAVVGVLSLNQPDELRLLIKSITIKIVDLMLSEKSLRFDDAPCFAGLLEDFSTHGWNLRSIDFNRDYPHIVFARTVD